jgi:hypothetical protein
MEVLSQVQSMVVEHAFTIGLGLLVAVILAGGVWYWMSRGSVKSNVLENNARVNNMDTMNVPPSAASAEPMRPMRPSQEDLEQQAAMAEGMPSQDNE